MMLSDRWTDEDKEFAAKVVNDIAEDIDCGESKKDLRKVIAILADQVYDHGVVVREMETAALMSKVGSFLPGKFRT